MFPINKNFLYYFLLAGFCSVIDVGVLYALTDWAGLFYLISATFSFIIAQSLNYYLNRRLNFRSKSEQVAKQLTMFISVNTVGLGISLGILAVFVEVFGLWYILARIISMLIAFNFNFYIHKRYTFVLFD
ncbi:GtrA family protein [Chloroflexota bacterium]